MEEKDKIEEIENRLDPRQKLTWNMYIDSKHKWFGNAYQAAMEAGYKESYAATITTIPWFKNKVRRSHLLGKAEVILDKVLTMDTVGDNGVEKADLVRVQADVAKHITKTLGKDEGYSEKTEISGGNSVVFLPQELIEKFNLGEKKVEPEVNNDSTDL